MLDTESFRIFLEFHDLPVDHIFFLLAIQREILGSEDQTQKKKHDGFVIPFMESCREKLASFGLAGDWVICKTMQNRLLLAFFRYLVIIMQKFVHQSIWYHSSLCFKYILVSSSFSSCSSKWTKKTKKKTLSPIFFVGADSNLPTFLSKVTYLNQPYNQPVPNHQAQSHRWLTASTSQRVPMASLSSATLAKSSLERVPGGRKRRGTSFSVFRTPPFSRGDGLMVFGFLLLGFFGAGFVEGEADGGEVLNEGFLKFWSRSGVFLLCWNWGGHKWKVTCEKRTQVLGKLEKKSRYCDVGWTTPLKKRKVALMNMNPVDWFSWPAAGKFLIQLAKSNPKLQDLQLGVPDGKMITNCSSLSKISMTQKKKKVTSKKAWSKKKNLRISGWF